MKLPESVANLTVEELIRLASVRPDGQKFLYVCRFSRDDGGYQGAYGGITILIAADDEDAVKTLIEDRDLSEKQARRFIENTEQKFLMAGVYPSQVIYKFEW